MKVGLRFSFPSYSYSFTNAYGNLIDATDQIVEPQFWAAYEWNIGSRFVVIPGLRWDMVSLAQLLSSGSNGYLADPRLSILYRINNGLVLTAGGGIYHQRIINLNDENEIYTPFDLIMPLPDSIDQESAWDCTLGIVTNPTALTTVKGEIYYKDFSRLVGINGQQVYATDQGFVSGSGHAYGAELSFKFDMETFYADVDYSYGMVTRELGGVSYIPRYDLRNQANFSMGICPAPGMWLRANWKIASGLPYTPLTGFLGQPMFDYTDIKSFGKGWVSPLPLFGAYNSARLPGYQSLDVSIEDEFQIFGKSVALQIAMINLYDRRNVYYVNNVTLAVEYELPRMANVSLAFKF